MNVKVMAFVLVFEDVLICGHTPQRARKGIAS